MSAHHPGSFFLHDNEGHPQQGSRESGDGSGIRNENMHPSEPGSHHVISVKSDGTFYSSAQNHNEPDSSDRVEPPPIQPRAFGLPPGPPPPGAILKPRDCDVLLGRGRPFHLHPGNQFMHKIVDHHKPGYLQSRRLDKIQIAILIVRQIQDAGGRFLKKDEELIYWYPVSDSVARKKVSHLLRERPNKSQREVVDARVKAAAEAAKIPPVANEPIAVGRGGNPVVASDATRAPVGGTNAGLMPPPALPSDAGYGTGTSPNHHHNENQNLNHSQVAPVVLNAGGYVPHLNGNGGGGYVHPPFGPPGHFPYGAPHHGSNAVASHSALLASYHHHRSMIEYHMRQLAQHPFHTAPGSQPFKMPLLPPPPAMGPSMPGMSPAQPDKSGVVAAAETAAPVASPAPAEVKPTVAAPSPEEAFLSGKSGPSLIKVNEAAAVNSLLSMAPEDKEKAKTQAKAKAKSGSKTGGDNAETKPSHLIRSKENRRKSRSPPMRAAADPPGDHYFNQEK